MTANPTACRMIGAGPQDKRQPDDYYATNPICVEPLLRAEPHLLKRDIWEPACGEGHISRVLKQHGIRVASTDLIDRGYGLGGIDFLRTTRLRAPVILTNPPFKLAVPFVRHALTLGAELVVMLLKLQFMECIDRAPVMEDCWAEHRAGLARVHVFKQRVALWKDGVPRTGGMLALGWYVWDRQRHEYWQTRRLEVRA